MERGNLTLSDRSSTQPTQDHADSHAWAQELSCTLVLTRSLLTRSNEEQLDLKMMLTVN